MPCSPQKIALFGGTFDPVHTGHLLIAETACVQFQLDQVIFIPCRQSPHKLHLKPTPPSHRLAMLKLATAEHPQFNISSVELRRPLPSFSYLTAETFAKKHPKAELFWILGTDQWKALPQWRNMRQLAELVTFIVFPRPTPPQPQHNIRFLHLPLRIDISSTVIRHQYQQKQPLLSAVPPAVHNYIQKHNLYS